MVICPYCKKQFTRQYTGHVYCTPVCRELALRKFVEGLLEAIRCDTGRLESMEERERQLSRALIQKQREIDVLVSELKEVRK